MGILRGLAFFILAFVSVAVHAKPESTDIVVSPSLYYKIVWELGDGVYGTAYKAYVNGNPQNEVILKVYKLARSKQMPIVLDNYRFVMNHRGDDESVTKIYGIHTEAFYEDAKHTVIVMERLDESIRDLSLRINLQQRIDIAPKILYDILQSIVFFNKNGRAHGDIHTENVMIRGLGKFVLNDFDHSVKLNPINSMIFDVEGFELDMPSLENDLGNLGVTMMEFLFAGDYTHGKDDDFFKIHSTAQTLFQRFRAKLDSRSLARFDLLRDYTVPMVDPVPEHRMRRIFEQVNIRNPRRGLHELLDQLNKFRGNNLTCLDLFLL